MEEGYAFVQSNEYSITTRDQLHHFTLVVYQVYIEFGSGSGLANSGA